MPKKIKKIAPTIRANRDLISFGISNGTTEIILASFFLKLRYMQERLNKETWTEDLRKEILLAREQYLKIIENSFYLD